MAEEAAASERRAREEGAARIRREERDAAAAWARDSLAAAQQRAADAEAEGLRLRQALADAQRLSVQPGREGDPASEAPSAAARSSRTRVLSRQTQTDLGTDWMNPPQTGGGAGPSTPATPAALRRGSGTGGRTSTGGRADPPDTVGLQHPFATPTQRKPGGARALGADAGEGGAQRGGGDDDGQQGAARKHWSKLSSVVSAIGVMKQDGERIRKSVSWQPQ